MQVQQVSQTYIAKTTNFEGPLDLLLGLIESRKLFINELSLSEVTTDYAEYVQGLKESERVPYYEITGYIVVLATLLLIKSRSLLPNFEINTEEAVSIEDLEERLKVYKIYKDIGKQLESLFGKNILYFKKPKKKDRVVFAPDAHIQAPTLALLLNELLSKVVLVQESEKLPVVQVRSSITIEDVMKKITDRISHMTSFSFNSLKEGVESKEEKVFTVISFLAILELIRTGILNAEQENTFGELNISKQIIS